MTEEIVLENGCTILLNNLDSANTVSIGIYVTVGSAMEEASQNGIAHFLEHMAFKGTKTLTAKQIAEKMDFMGADMNAHTAKEYTCYYITLLPHWLKEGVVLLSDIFLNSILADSDIEMERNVIFEEIHMVEDTPDENIHDIFANTIWHNSSLGLPILGTKEVLVGIHKPELEAFKAHYLNPQNLIISVAGKIPNPRKLVRQLTDIFQGLSPNPDLTYPCTLPQTYSQVAIQHKSTEQIHLCMGLPSVPYSHPDHYKLSLINTILGGTMSSRLFQELREKQGLAYAIYSYLSFHKETGLFVIYAGFNKKQFKDTIKTILQEIDRLKKTISARELKKAKEHLKGSIAIDLEKPSSWMSWQARNKFYLQQLVTLDDVFNKIDQVTLEDINLYANRYFVQDQFSIAAIGPFSKDILSLNGLQTNQFLSSL